MSSSLALNFTTAYARRLNTTTNMTAVTSRTNSERPWIAWAGVETGAKMFVGLSGEGVDCAEAVEASKHSPTRTNGPTRMREWLECVVCMSDVGACNKQQERRSGKGSPPFLRNVSPFCKPRVRSSPASRRTSPRAHLIHESAWTSWRPIGCFRDQATTFESGSQWIVSA